MDKKFLIIFFDLDGTLVNSFNIHKQAYINTLKHSKIKFSEKTLNKILGDKTEKIFYNLGIKNDKIINYLSKKVEQERKNYVKKLTLCKHVITTLKTLKQKNYKIYIISNASKYYLHEAVKKFNLKQYITKAYGSEDFSNKAEMIKKILKKEKINNKKQAIFVGDRYSDIINAKKAGITSVAISSKTSWSTKKELLKQNPNFIISDLKNVARIKQK